MLKLLAFVLVLQAPAYPLTLLNATIVGNHATGGDYAAGVTVEIVANPAPACSTFIGWSKTPAALVLADASKPITTLTTLDQGMRVVANYRDLAGCER